VVDRDGHPRPGATLGLPTGLEPEFVRQGAHEQDAPKAHEQESPELVKRVGS
jgi:hypothetical protein